MLFRLLLILLLIFFLALAGLWVARILFFRWLGKKLGPAMEQHRQQQHRKDEQIDVLVPCKRCGTFVPKHQAVQKEQDYYCRDHA